MSRDHYGYNPQYGTPNDSRYAYGSPDSTDRSSYSYPNQEGGYFNSGLAYTPDAELEYDPEGGRHPATRPNPLLRSDTQVEMGSGSGYGDSGGLRPARPNSLLRTDTHQGSGYDPQARPNPLQRSDTDIEIEGFKRPNLLVRSDTDFDDPRSDPPVHEHEGSHRETSTHQSRYGAYTDRERHTRGAGSGAYYEGERTYGGGRHGGTAYEEKHGSRRPGGYPDDERDGGYAGYERRGGY